MGVVRFGVVELSATNHRWLSRTHRKICSITSCVGSEKIAVFRRINILKSKDVAAGRHALHYHIGARELIRQGVMVLLRRRAVIAIKWRVH